jgi:hypothetical protein
MIIFFEVHTRGNKVEYKNIRENHPNDTQHHLNTLGIWSDRNIMVGGIEVDRYWIDTEIYKPSRFWKDANSFMKMYFREKKLKTLKDKIK